MTRRMSNRLAARTSSLCSARSVREISLRASCAVPVRVAMTTVSFRLDEEQVQHDDDGEGGEAQHLGVAPPDAVGGAQARRLLALAGQAPDEAAELLLWLGL